MYLHNPVVAESYFPVYDYAVHAINPLEVDFHPVLPRDRIAVHVLRGCSI
jgi:hypothetical protein